MTRARLAAAAALAVVSLATVAHAQAPRPKPWDRIARACYEAVLKQHPDAASGGDLVYPAAQCTAHSYLGDRAAPPARVKRCLEQVYEQTHALCEACADRIDLVMACLGAR